MKGNIYSDERCFICGNRFKHFEPKDLSCPNHPESKPTRFKVIFGNITKRFRSYESAYRFLTGLRFKTDEKTFDERDYRKDNPLGFTNLAEQWLIKRKKEVTCFRNLRCHMRYASDFFENKNIKELNNSASIDSFFDSLPEHLSEKSRWNIKTTLHTFWTWLEGDIEIIDKIPKFPSNIKNISEKRKTIDKETQSRVLEEVKRITWHINPKIYIGILWLSTYVNVRPIELLNIKEEDFDLNYGVLNIRRNKKDSNNYKEIYLLEEDVELIKRLPRGLPHLYFFRHGKRKGVHADKRGRFGKDYWYKWWRIACENLGVEDVPLYPGTRHSSISALSNDFDEKKIQNDGTGHKTSKAFLRYFHHEAEQRRRIFDKARGKAEVINFKDRLTRF